MIAGDKGQLNLGVDEARWDQLAEQVDLIVDCAALVNGVLPYREHFGPNVVGTAELIRLAITTKLKASPMSRPPAWATRLRRGIHRRRRHQDRRTVPHQRGGYSNGYANSKWAGEVLLREAHDLCGLPVAVFRLG